MPRKLSDSPRAIKAREERAKQQKSDTIVESVDAEEVPTDQAQGFSVNVEEAPQETFTEEKKPGVLDTVLTRLGIKEDKTAPPVKVPTGAKLNAAQVQFCDMATPIGTSLLIISLAWAWGQLDADYRALAPSEDAATSIVAPLIRIYARSNKALIRSASPNTVDALMALNGVIMYLHASLTMLHEINATKKAMQDDESNRPRNINTARSTESRVDYAGDRRASVSRADDASLESDATSASLEYPSGLNERERQNFSRLAELRERDIASRARRSGRLG